MQLLTRTLRDLGPLYTHRTEANEKSRCNVCLAVTKQSCMGKEYGHLNLSKWALIRAKLNEGCRFSQLEAAP
jgi:hypothetical protein